MHYKKIIFQRLNLYGVFNHLNRIERKKIFFRGKNVLGILKDDISNLSRVIRHRFTLKTPKKHQITQYRCEND